MSEDPAARRSLILAGVLLSCHGPAGAPHRDTAPEVSPRPASCRTLSSGVELLEALQAAAAGSAFCLEPGEYSGAFELPEGITLWGPRSAVVKTAGKGTTVLMHSKTALLGLTVDGSGGRFDVLDAAVKVHGEDVVVRGVLVKNSVFGILSERSRRVRIEDNEVRGTGGPALGMRGDGIRLWETYESQVLGNDVRDARDCVVWYSTDNVVRGNTVRDGRYGVHIMYSHRNLVEDNHFTGNEVGIFIMYSRDVQVKGNWMLRSAGASGIGLGIKESGNLNVRGNRLVHNTQGIFLDTSPMNEGDVNVFEDNEVRMSDVGIGFLSSQKNNSFKKNRFQDNFTQVRVDGGGDALSVAWEENAWSDYQGYDLDGDGLGDIPHELRDLAGALEARYPDLAFFRGTPALALLSVAGHVVPLFQPKTVLRDDRPRVGYEEDGDAD